MSHRYDIEIEDERLGPGRHKIPSIVPGNEGLQKDVEGGNLRKPRKDEVGRAIDEELRRREKQWQKFKWK